MPVRRYRRRARAPRGRKLNKREKNEVKRLISVRQELKYHVSQTSALAVGTAGQIFQISDIPQGDTDITRDGDRLMLKKFFVRGSILYSDATNIFRLIFFQWKPATTPTIASILLNGPSVAPDVWSSYAHDQRQMYNILWDKTWHLEGNAAAATSPLTPTSQKLFKVTIARRFAKQLQYTAGTTAGTNQIWYLALSDSAAVGHPGITMSVKFHFTDS